MSKYLKRYDILFILLLFLLTIPSEYYEIFSLAENQLISFRHLMRTSFGDREKMKFPQDKIVFVIMDENFFEEYGSFPFRRTDLAKIVRNLNFLGAKVICIDILMDFNSSYNEDPYLAEALKQANTVLASQVLFDKKDIKKIRYPAILLKNSSASGYVNISSSSSISTYLSRLKIHPEITKLDDGWPIAIRTVSKYLGVKPEIKNGNLILNNISIPLNQFNDIYIDFPIIPEGQRFISQIAGITAFEFLDLSELDEDEIDELRYWIDGKIVLIGDTSEVSHDWFDTPAGMIYGVEIVANTVNTILNNAPLQPVSLLSEIFICFLFLSLLSCSSFANAFWLKNLLVFILFTGFIYVCTILYVYNGIVISMIYTLIAGILGYSGISLYSYVQERKLKKEMQARSEFIRNTFGRYLSDEIVQNILETPGGLQLGGEKKLLTIMMTDLRGFTALSERLPPEDVVSIINNYLEEMTPIIIKYHGTIDEFIGDAILIIFGAPIVREDDTQRAAACAIEMQLAMERVNKKNKERGLPEVEQGIGMNTGEVVVGNIGSEIRSKYGVVGKNVNLTSRIESYTVGGQIMISEKTKNEAGSILKINSQMEVMPKGVKLPITIYELAGIDGKFNIYLPEKKKEKYIELSELLSVQVIAMDGKHAESESFNGKITHLTSKTATLQSEFEVKKLNNLKLTLFSHDGNKITKNLYSKVTDVLNKNSFIVNFTSIPPEAEKFFTTLLQTSIVKKM
ncbi:adenylate cyclase [Candidatus Magnetomoraceae bacterium gMMP-1]